MNRCCVTLFLSCAKSPSFAQANTTIFEILTKLQSKWPRLQKFCLGFSELLKLNPGFTCSKNHLVKRGECKSSKLKI